MAGSPFRVSVYWGDRSSISDRITRVAVHIAQLLPHSDLRPWVLRAREVAVVVPNYLTTTTKPPHHASAQLPLDIPANEGLDGIARGVVIALLHRGLHEVGGGGEELAADSAIQPNLGRANGIDDDAGRVG